MFEDYKMRMLLILITILNSYKVQYELEISEKGLNFKGFFDGLAC